MDKLVLKAEIRKIAGKKVKSLRKQGVLPANVYGKKTKSQAVQVKLSDFEKVYGTVGETGLVELAVNGGKKPILIHSVQIDPVSDSPIHADFLQVDLKEKVVAQVPIETVGESPAEKSGVGTVVIQLNEIEVEALPGDLPEKFVADVSSLAEVDQTIFVKDLSVDKKKVSIKSDTEAIVAKVVPPQKIEEVVAAPEVQVPPAEGEAEGRPVEGEAPEGELPQPEGEKKKPSGPPGP